MLTVEQAIQTLGDSARTVKTTEQVDLGNAAGRVLARSVVAEVNVPPADNSAMDGYALRHADWQDAESFLPVSQRITAGSLPLELTPGTAARIFTGAEIPAGADTVVMQENTEAEPGTVRILEMPASSTNIRPCGQDISKGKNVLVPGTRIGPPELGLLASIGQARVEVFRRLKVAIVSNGDELAEPGVPLEPGQIYNSNRYLLKGLVESWGFEAVDMGIAGDEPEKIAALLESASQKADVIISSGGVSVGEEDHIKSVVESLGSIDLWKIAIKPGKPLAYGRVKSTPFIGLPGNPASVLVTCLVIARPFLLQMQGLKDFMVNPVQVSACFASAGTAREEYLRGLRGRDGVEIYPNQSSGVLLSSCWGDGLVIKYVGQEIQPGDTVDFLPYALLR